MVQDSNGNSFLSGNEDEIVGNESSLDSVEITTCGLDIGLLNNKEILSAPSKYNKEERLPKDKNDEQLGKGTEEEQLDKEEQRPKNMHEDQQGKGEREGCLVASILSPGGKVVQEESVPLEEETELPSPPLWGHKVQMVDELDQRRKKNIKKSAQRKKKWISAPKGSKGVETPSSS